MCCNKILDFCDFYRESLKYLIKYVFEVFNLGSRNDGSFMFINPPSGVTALVRLTMPCARKSVPLYGYVHSESTSLVALVHLDEPGEM